MPPGSATASVPGRSRRPAGWSGTSGGTATRRRRRWSSSSSTARCRCSSRASGSGTGRRRSTSCRRAIRSCRSSSTSPSRSSSPSRVARTSRAVEGGAPEAVYPRGGRAVGAAARGRRRHVPVASRGGRRAGDRAHRPPGLDVYPVVLEDRPAQPPPLPLAAGRPACAVGDPAVRPGHRRDGEAGRAALVRGVGRLRPAGRAAHPGRARDPLRSGRGRRRRDRGTRGRERLDRTT